MTPCENFHTVKYFTPKINKNEESVKVLQMKNEKVRLKKVKSKVVLYSYYLSPSPPAGR
jgi:hypothetical protein